MAAHRDMYEGKRENIEKTIAFELFVPCHCKAVIPEEPLFCPGKRKKSILPAPGAAAGQLRRAAGGLLAAARYGWAGAGHPMDG